MTLALFALQFVHSNQYPKEWIEALSFPIKSLWQSRRGVRIKNMKLNLPAIIWDAARYLVLYWYRTIQS